MMRIFALTLFVLGVLVVTVGGFVISALVALRRRREKRAQSAHATAVRFRRRYGEKAERAVAQMLDRDGLSDRKRRFYRTVAIELKGADTLRDAPISAKRNEDEAVPGGAAPVVTLARGGRP